MKKKILKTTVEEVFEYDIICCDVPLLIRLMEFAREEANSDAQLHLIAEKMIECAEYGETLTMEHYSKIISDATSK